MATAQACREIEQMLSVAEENALAVAEAGEKAERALAAREEENAVLRTEAADACAAGWPRCQTSSRRAGRRSKPSARLLKACARRCGPAAGASRRHPPAGRRGRAAAVSPGSGACARAAAEQAAAVTGARLENAEAQVADLKARLTQAGRGR